MRIVLTSIFVDDQGREMKAFSVLDGLGMKLAMQAGIAVAWITGSHAPAVEHRARQLGVHQLVLGAEHKLPAWERLCAQSGLAPEACAHVGDDLPDVPVFRRCGLAITVPGAPATVAAHAHFATRTGGGMGAATIQYALSGPISSVRCTFMAHWGIKPDLMMASSSD